MKHTLSILLSILYTSCSSESTPEKSRVETVYKEVPVESKAAETKDLDAKASVSESSEEVKQNESNTDEKNDYGIDPLTGTKERALLTVELYMEEVESNGTVLYNLKEDSSRTDPGYMRVFRAQINGSVPLRKCLLVPDSSKYSRKSYYRLTIEKDCKAISNESNTYQDEGILGYVYSDLSKGTKIAMCFKHIPNDAGGTDNIETVNDSYEKCPTGFQYLTSDYKPRFYASYPSEPVYSEE